LKAQTRRSTESEGKSKTCAFEKPDKRRQGEKHSGQPVAGIYARFIVFEIRRMASQPRLIPRCRRPGLLKSGVVLKRLYKRSFAATNSLYQSLYRFAIAFSIDCQKIAQAIH